LQAIVLQQQQWLLAWFWKMPLDLPAWPWAESIYGNSGTPTDSEWDAWKTIFLGQFLTSNKLQTAQMAFDIVRMDPCGSDVLTSNEAFREATFRPDSTQKANKFMLIRDRLALRYLTELTGAVWVYVNSVVNINTAANLECKQGGLPSIKFTVQHLVSEAV
jgi:hypothetical protein